MGHKHLPCWGKLVSVILGPSNEINVEMRSIQGKYMEYTLWSQITRYVYLKQGGITNFNLRGRYLKKGIEFNSHLAIHPCAEPFWKPNCRQSCSNTHKSNCSPRYPKKYLECELWVHVCQIGWYLHCQRSFDSALSTGLFPDRSHLRKNKGI